MVVQIDGVQFIIGTEIGGTGGQRRRGVHRCAQVHAPQQPGQTGRFGRHVHGPHLQPDGFNVVFKRPVAGFAVDGKEITVETAEIDSRTADRRR